MADQRTILPEEQELERKLNELAKLQSELADRELELATLQAELRQFERRYIGIIGVRYAELDEIEAQIAEARARVNPGDQDAKRQAEQARRQARQSAQAAGSAKDWQEQPKFGPSEQLKKLYREVAKSVHPDLAADEEDRTHRERLMAEANLAYANGDENRLRAILRDWKSSPESVRGEGTAAELVRVIRKIAQIENRLKAIQVETSRLNESDLFQVKLKVEKAEEQGRDLLAEMAAQLDGLISSARKRLADLARQDQ